MQIWVNINGVQSGPISREALAEIVTDPSVTYVWHQGMSNWERIDRLPEFADIVAAAPKAPAVPEASAEPEKPELSDRSDSSDIAPPKFLTFSCQAQGRLSPKAISKGRLTSFSHSFRAALPPRRGTTQAHCLGVSSTLPISSNHR